MCCYVDFVAPHALVLVPYFACIGNILKALVLFKSRHVTSHANTQGYIWRRGKKTREQNEKLFFFYWCLVYIEKVILYSVFVCSNGTSFQCLFVNQKYYKRNLNLSFYLLLLRWVFMMVVTSDNPSLSIPWIYIAREDTYTCLVCILCKKRCCKYVSFLVARNEGTLKSMSRTCECSERYFIWKDFILF